MAYTKVYTTWHDDPIRDTAISAAALNQIEAGIVSAAVVADSSQTQANTLSAFFRIGTGSPEGIVTAPVGTLFFRTDGSAGTTLYVKEIGSGNTGWTAK